MTSTKHAIPLHVTLLYTSRLHGQLLPLPRLFSLIQRERTAAARIASMVILLDLGESCAVESWLCQATAGRAVLVAMDSFGNDGFYLDQADPLSADPNVLAKLRAVITTPVFSEQQPLIFRKRVINATSDSAQPFCVLSWEAPLPISAENAAAEPFALTIRVNRHIPNSNTVRYDPLNRTLWVADPAGEAADDVGLTRVTLARYSDDVFQLDQQRLALTPDLPPDPTISGVVDFVLAEAGYTVRNAERINRQQHDRTD